MPELNLDGLVGPTHNYAGLAVGNIAATAHGGAVSSPRAAALEGLAKMRFMVRLGLPQGLLVPHDRPATGWLRAMGFEGTDSAVLAAAARDEPGLLAAAASASAMWTANAATVSPAADTADGRVHVTVANLASMPHRSHEAEASFRQLALALADRRHFAIHPALPPAFGDEGAANHMRLAPGHETPGVEVFVHAPEAPTRFPARQHPGASRAVARRHSVRDALFAPQTARAIDAGAFHNDVVALAHRHCLFAHEQAFERRADLLRAIAPSVPGFALVEATAAELPLADTVASYVFNAQLVDAPHLPPDAMLLVVPQETRANPAAWAFVERVVRDAASPIAEAAVVPVGQSMDNGGGPACLRLRLALSAEALAAVDRRFLVHEARLDLLHRLVEERWPRRIAPADLALADLWQEARAAREALLALLELPPGL